MTCPPYAVFDGVASALAQAQIYTELHGRPFKVCKRDHYTFMVVDQAEEEAAYEASLKLERQAALLQAEKCKKRHMPENPRATGIAPTAPYKGRPGMAQHEREAAGRTPRPLYA